MSRSPLHQAQPPDLALASRRQEGEPKRVRHLALQRCSPQAERHGTGTAAKSCHQ